MVLNFILQISNVLIYFVLIIMIFCTDVELQKVG